MNNTRSGRPDGALEAAPADSTGRAQFDAAVVHEVGRARRHGHDVALIALEVHDAPAARAVRDRVIEETGEILREVVRTYDRVAHLGDGLFAWLLPETSVRGAVVAAERARAFIGTITLPGGYGAVVSCGISDAGSARHDATELRRQAHAALRQGAAGTPGGIARFAAGGALAAEHDLSDDARQQALARLRLLGRVLDRTCAPATGRSEDVARLAKRIARGMGWTVADAGLLYEAALVRDIGMMGIAEEIRRMQGELTGVDRERIQLHPALGAHLLSQVLTPQQVSWVRHHHERFDGAGYPDGRHGEGIPEGARIIAVADAWTASLIERHAGEGDADLLLEMERQAGWHFCPTAVAALRGLVGDASEDAPEASRTYAVVSA